MQVWLNDVITDLPPDLCLDQALKNWSYDGLTIAVAINHVFIPKLEHQHTRLQAGDRIDIVSPMQGG